MKKVLIFGLMSGGLIALMSSILTPLCMSGAIDFDHSEVLGYTIMVLAFLLVFFAIRSYRENPGGGVISFGKAVQVGLVVTLVASAIYIVAWEIVYYNFIPDFADKYGAHVVKRMETKGAPPAEIDKTRAEMARFKELYKNPFVNVGMTFIEVFPVGLVVTLVSAAILRRKAPPGVPATAAPAAS